MKYEEYFILNPDSLPALPDVNDTNALLPLDMTSLGRV